ncbi:uncharacterized protein LAESUDRAFT_727416 [Laetiporus sulphureus 93-53]|uniref:Uncharacterized protein n=1 Tax=Laetiporus sulphureus 93-53 TaxID=1314785 RepID=A0A165DLU6_9APHY|nr:uncharacterized protein LAESUDRAFT_727416 [Laetiporus sulphureus 93-53]KZT05165.1 hypothetical protein LAESUDRAFT_727416 [Laetiporus sulphureus 93-53]
MTTDKSTSAATLVLLLSVSAAIVVRSYILRRRQRRLFEEAMQNGSFSMPSSAPGRRRWTLTRPVLHDAHVCVDYDSHEKTRYVRGGEGSGKVQKWWARTLPVAARLVVAPNTAMTTPSPYPVTRSPTPWHRRLLSRVSPSRALSPRTRSNSSPPPRRRPSPPSFDDLESQPRAIELTYLVAMPAPRRENFPAEHAYIPQVEFGIERVPVCEDPGEGWTL